VRRHDLIRLLVDAGCCLHRHGARHDIYINPRNGRKAPVPRHNEVRNSLAELIRRQLGV
jgi:mRNA interferase HicA